jgi:hypothetical protein
MPEVRVGLDDGEGHPDDEPVEGGGKGSVPGIAGWKGVQAHE